MFGLNVKINRVYSEDKPIFALLSLFRTFRQFITLNLSSMVLRVVEVVMVQVPPSSLIFITGVDTVAAFLSKNPTFISFRNSS